MTTEVTYSKNGWPLGTTRHFFGYVLTTMVDDLCQKLKVRFGIEFTASSLPSEAADPTIGLVATARISMEKYGQIRAFIDGYKAAQY